LAALSALHGDFYALPDARSLRSGNRCQSLILGLLAGLATLGLIPQTLVLKEELFASRPDKTLSAIHAPERAVLKLRLRVAPFTIRAFHYLYLCHDEKSPTDMCSLYRADRVSLKPLRSRGRRLRVAQITRVVYGKSLGFWTA
jgi:hypothetical protein